jgi:hypothetical protein
VVVGGAAVVAGATVVVEASLVGDVVSSALVVSSPALEHPSIMKTLAKAKTITLRVWVTSGDINACGGGAAVPRRGVAGDTRVACLHLGVQASEVGGPLIAASAAALIRIRLA